MQTTVEIEVTGSEEQGFSFGIPHLPIKVGQQLTIDVSNYNPAKWAVKECIVAVEVEEIEYYITDMFGNDRTTCSIQTLYCKLIESE